MTQWIKHDGGPMPVHPETVVDWSCLELGKSSVGCQANNLHWVGRGGPLDITEYAIIRTHPDCPSLKNAAVDMARAGIAPSVAGWRYEDVGETWRVWSGECEYFTAKESDAQWLADRLSGKA